MDPSAFGRKEDGQSSRVFGQDARQHGNHLSPERQSCEPFEKAIDSFHEENEIQLRLGSALHEACFFHRRDTSCFLEKETVPFGLGRGYKCSFLNRLLM